MNWILIVSGIVLVGAATFYFSGFPTLSGHERVRPVNGIISIPLSAVSDSKAHFFRFSENGKDLKFFVIQGNDGLIRTAFDSCDVCFPEKKGYVQDGDSLVCINCNKRFATVRIGGQETGGCNPAYLPHRQQSGNIIISEHDLKSGARLF